MLSYTVIQGVLMGNITFKHPEEVAESVLLWSLLGMQSSSNSHGESHHEEGDGSPRVVLLGDLVVHVHHPNNQDAVHGLEKKRYSFESQTPGCLTHWFQRLHRNLNIEGSNQLAMSKNRCCGIDKLQPDATWLVCKLILQVQTSWKMGFLLMR